jgi:hypothetical protein
VIEAVVIALLAQLVLLHLAGRAQRDAVDEHHVVGRPPLGDPALEEAEQLLLGHLGAGLLHHDQEGPLVPLRVLGGDARGHRHRRVGHRDVLDVDRADPLAPALDHVLGPVGDVHETVRVDGGHIPGGEPAVHQR